MTRRPWSILPTTLLILSSFPFCLGQNQYPEVQVTLQAHWSSPHYLLEILEGIHTHNQSAFAPFLKFIVEEDGDLSLAKPASILELSLKLIEKEALLSRTTLDLVLLGLGLHESQPSIQAQFEWYATAHLNVCSREMSFDHVVGKGQEELVYVDMLHRDDILLLREHLANSDQKSLRIRWRPSKQHEAPPSILSGFGAHLDLKRTDYMVIDDRDLSQDHEELSNSTQSAHDGPLDDLFADHQSDVRPLSASQVTYLGLKASQFVASSADPFKTLVRLTQDFPKYSQSIAALLIDEDLAKDVAHAQRTAYRAGQNAIWVNGQMLDPRDVDPFRFLNLLQKENDLIDKLESFGMTGAEAITLLASQAKDEEKNGIDAAFDGFLDIRDTEEPGAIVWLNDIETDAEYTDFVTTLSDILRPLYPGSLHNLKFNIWTVVFAVRLDQLTTFQMILAPASNFIARHIPIRFGIVPIMTEASELSRIMTSVIYHLQLTAGSRALRAFIELIAQRTTLAVRDVKHCYNEIREKNSRKIATMLPFDDIFDREGPGLEQIQIAQQNAGKWARRIQPEDTGLGNLYINGQHAVMMEEWARMMMYQIQHQMPVLQQAVYLKALKADMNILSWILERPGVLRSANKWIVPTDDRPLKFVDIADLLQATFHREIKIDWIYPTQGVESSKVSASVMVIGDLNAYQGMSIVESVLRLTRKRTDTRSTILPFSKPSSSLIANHFERLKMQDATYEDNVEVREPNMSEQSESIMGKAFLSFIKGISSNNNSGPATGDHDSMDKDASVSNALFRTFKMNPGECAIVINGRIVGPFPASSVEQIDVESLLTYELRNRITNVALFLETLPSFELYFKGALRAQVIEKVVPLIAQSQGTEDDNPFRSTPRQRTRLFEDWPPSKASFTNAKRQDAAIEVIALVDPLSEDAQKWSALLEILSKIHRVNVEIFLNPIIRMTELSIKRFYRYNIHQAPRFTSSGDLEPPTLIFRDVPVDPLYSLELDSPPAWLVKPLRSVYDLDNIRLSDWPMNARHKSVEAAFRLRNILVEGHAIEGQKPPRGVQMTLGGVGTIVMNNLGYLQFASNPGVYQLALVKGSSSEIFKIDAIDGKTPSNQCLIVSTFNGLTIFPKLVRLPGKEQADVLEFLNEPQKILGQVKSGIKSILGKTSAAAASENAEINIFSVASGHLYERFLAIMTQSVMRHTTHTVKFWFIENFLSPSFIEFLPYLAEEYGFRYELVTYKWPHWLRAQKEKQRVIWGYKILFLDVLFPLNLDKVIFVDADQIVRTDLKELIDLDLKGAPYGYTPMCDSRKEMDGFRFWKTGYWKDFLGKLPYHISALYVIDLKRFRQLAAGDQLRGQYQALTADPNSLANLDQDLPNNLQHNVPIFSLPQDWLWCETWCDDESLKTAKTIDLCNNPLTHEPKLQRARRQIPEWTEYDDNVARLNARLTAAKRLSSQAPNAASSANQVALGRDLEEAEQAAESPLAHAIHEDL